MDNLMFLLDFGRFLGSQKLDDMEVEAKSRCQERELEDGDLEAVSAAGEAEFYQNPEEDSHGY